MRTASMLLASVVLFGSNGVAMAQAATAPAAASDQTEPAFVLVERGESPRRELRYTLGERVERVRSEDATNKTASMNGMAMPPEVDTEIVAVRLEVEAVEDGVARFVVSGQGEGSSDGWLTNGERYRALVSATGHVTEIETLEGEESQIDEDNLRSLIVRLPEEAVGVGATWREVRVLDEAGMRGTMVFTRTIKAIRGDEIEIESRGEATIESNGEPLEGMPPGMTVESLSGGGTLEGVATITLGRLLPVAVRDDGEIAMAIVTGGANAMRLSMNNSTKKTAKAIEGDG